MLCIQAEATKVRDQLKAQEAEALARRKQQEGQQSGIWRDLVTRMQSLSSLPEESTLVRARDREQKVQEMLGPPPEPPIAPKGDCDVSACFATFCVPQNGLGPLLNLSSARSNSGNLCIANAMHIA